MPISMVICSTLAAMITRIAMPGTVSSESEMIRMIESGSPPKNPAIRASVRPARAPYPHRNAASKRGEGGLIHEVVADKGWHHLGARGR